MNWSDIDWLIDLSVFGGDSLNRKRKSVRGMEKTSEVIALGLHGLFTSPSFSWEYIGSQSQLGFIFHSLYSQFLTQFYSISFIFSFFFLILFIILFFFFNSFYNSFFFFWNGDKPKIPFVYFTLLYFLWTISIHLFLIECCLSSNLNELNEFSFDCLVKYWVVKLFGMQFDLK